MNRTVNTRFASLVHAHSLRMLLLLATLLVRSVAALAQTTSFTYQGRLNDGANAANGAYEIQFKLFDAVTAGTQIGTTFIPTPAGVVVTNGAFTVTLDFGAAAFPGADRFLEISVKPPNGTAFTKLTPRQRVTATPYSLRSLNATSADKLSAACTGCVTDAQIAAVAGSKVTGTIPAAAVPTGSGNYIQNTTTKQSANLNISGDATVGGLFGTFVSADQSVVVDRTGINNGTTNGGLFPGLVFGAYPVASGEGISSKRTAGGNQFGLDFFTGYTSRMSITSGGKVGIGTTNPAGKLEVVSEQDSVNSTRFYQYGNTNHTIYFGRATGTAKAPSDVKNGDVLGRILAAGYQLSGFQGGGKFTPLSASIEFRADSDFANSPGGPGSIHFLAQADTGGPFIRDVMSVNFDGVTIYPGGSSGVPQLDVQGNLKARFMTADSYEWGNRAGLVNNQGGSIELGAGNTNAGTGTPFIDFHYNGKAQDYNVRLINDSDGTLTLNGRMRATAGFNGTCVPGNFINYNGTCQQDLAETFRTKEQTQPGDVVTLIPRDSDKPTVRKALSAYDDHIVGVVSMNPGLVFDEGETHLAGGNDQLITKDKTVVAVVGRVFVRMSLENGAINVGDPLTSSATNPGTAMKATQAGKIIGYALESSDKATKENREGKLLMWLQVGHYLPPSSLARLRKTGANGKDAAAMNAQVEQQVKAQVKIRTAELEQQLQEFNASNASLNERLATIEQMMQQLTDKLQQPRQQ